MRIAHLSPEDAVESLRSSLTGLTGVEARRRLAEYGPNRVEEVRSRSLVLRFLEEFTHFFALILWVAAGLAFAADSWQPGEEMATLAWAIVGVIAINGVFSFWQEYRAERAIAALKGLLPRQATALREGIPCLLPAEELVPGDVILLSEGDSVPADCRLIASFAMRLNLATLTGESLPRARSAAACGEDDPLRAGNMLPAGSSIVAGEGRALVVATGMRTEFGRIASLTQIDEPPSPLQLEIARMSRFVAVFAGVLGAVFFLIGRAAGLTFWESAIFAIGIIVANVPEGLLPTVTLSLAMATQRMAKRNALVRHLNAVETLGAASVICTDKTGTLTENHMAARRLFVTAGNFELNGREPALDPAYRPLFEAAAHCQTVKRVTENGATRVLGDPMETALMEMAADAGVSVCNERVDEVPFDAERRRMSTVHQTTGGRTLYCKGAPEAVFPLCRKVVTAEGAEALTGEIARRFEAAQEEMTAAGLRVLAFAHRKLADDAPQEDWEADLVLAGLVGLEDPPRPEVPEAIAKCHVAGIRVVMITGDHPRTARAVARAVGLAHEPTVVTGDELRRLSDTQLQVALDEPGILFARVTAEQKLRIVEAFQRKGHVVGVTGDGVNDAPALRRADIGIAMGVAGSDVAREAADIVLLDDNFASIVNAVEEGRAVFQNIRKFLTYILSSNVPEIVPYLAFALFRIPLPLTIIQILAVDLGTDMLPALALGVERPDAGAMREPPRARSARLLDWPLLARSYLFLGTLEAVAAMAAFFIVLKAGGWQYGDLPGKADPLYLQATTACLAAIVVMQVVNVLSCRHPDQSAFAGGWPRNPFLFWGIACELILLAFIVYTPWGNAIFGAAPIAAYVWLLLVPFALGMLLLEEARKALVRRGQ